MHLIRVIKLHDLPRDRPGVRTFAKQISSTGQRFGTRYHTIIYNYETIPLHTITNYNQHNCNYIFSFEVGKFLIWLGGGDDILAVFDCDKRWN